MLVFKKKIIILNVKKNSCKTKFIYFYFKKKEKLLLYLFNCYIQQYDITLNSLKYFYSFKLKSPVFYILETNLNYLLELLFSFSTLSLFTNLKSLQKSKRLLSVLRSPFVYKKSMEQLFSTLYKITYKTHITKYDIILKNYQFTFLKIELEQNSILKFFFKIIFLFK